MILAQEVTRKKIRAKDSSAFLESEMVWEEFITHKMIRIIVTKSYNNHQPKILRKKDKYQCKM